MAEGSEKVRVRDVMMAVTTIVGFAAAIVGYEAYRRNMERKTLPDGSPAACEPFDSYVATKHRHAPFFFQADQIKMIEGFGDLLGCYTPGAKVDQAILDRACAKAAADLSNMKSRQFILKPLLQAIAADLQCKIEAPKSQPRFTFRKQPVVEKTGGVNAFLRAIAALSERDASNPQSLAELCKPTLELLKKDNVIPDLRVVAKFIADNRNKFTSLRDVLPPNMTSDEAQAEAERLVSIFAPLFLTINETCNLSNQELQELLAPGVSEEQFVKYRMALMPVVMEFAEMIGTDQSPSPEGKAALDAIMRIYDAANVGNASTEPAKK